MSLYNIIRNSRSLSIDTQMDLIYDHTDLLMRTGDWRTLNSELNDIIINLEDVSLDCLLGVVCATLPGENDLISRRYLVEKCKEKYPDPGLWKGL